MKKFRLIYKYLLHLIRARNTRGYGVHSPYMFNFIRHILSEKHPYYVFRDIERIRNRMLNDERVVRVTDFGTGKNKEKRICDIARKALKKPEQAQLLFRIIRHYDFKNILELGTSLGISTMYMASVSTKSRCITLEGCPALCALARQNFDKLGNKQINLINCNIDERLENILNEYGQLDFIFIDANHRFDALIRYFELCVNRVGDYSMIVVDDIYWSAEMEAAWNAIKKHPRVKVTIDIFHMGFVFFNPMLTKKHYKVRY
ncbi:MAG: class I SAM-dependent methyltransferase [Paludibacter sp.]|nr:class I SAM-dependent methyltransferase [Paludibacter sp.]MDD4198051.1 class I SAM-dependent methyltransferase [Paludibacter sp.]MDD4427026.1 class I SAM-dependent methyltransferase [Paludibacter sp.]